MGKRVRLNVQGLARRSPEVVGCIVPDPGYVTVSIDLAAGEPTVSSHYSQDKHYRYACFDGVGKAPYYDSAVLMISDIYLMVMSVSPLGRDKMRDVFDNARFEGRTFAEQWLVDDEVCKKYLKKERQLHKMLCLALGYGMRPKKMVKQCYDNGFDLPLKVAQEFFEAYWQLFSGIKGFASKLEREFAAKGYLVNQFGYRLVPDKSFKVWNYYIQSSVSGLMHVFLAKLMAAAPWALFITIIHDEVLVDVPEERLDEFRRIKEMATASLNADLKWTVNIRTGFAVGRTWFDAK